MVQRGYQYFVVAIVANAISFIEGILERSVPVNCIDHGKTTDKWTWLAVAFILFSGALAREGQRAGVFFPNSFELVGVQRQEYELRMFLFYRNICDLKFISTKIRINRVRIISFTSY